MTSCKLFHNFWLASALRGIGRPTRGAPPGWPPVWGRRWCLSLIAKRAREGRPQRRRHPRARSGEARGRRISVSGSFAEEKRKSRGPRLRRLDEGRHRLFRSVGDVLTPIGTEGPDALQDLGLGARNRSSCDRRLPRRVRWPPRCCPRARSPAPACRARCRGRVSRFQLADRSSRNLRR